MLANKGFLTKRKSTSKIIDNLNWGKEIAKKIASLNIGQSIIIGNHIVISIEGIEGTDNMIKRSKDLLFKDSYFIKTAKLNHNPQYDLPVFGLGTLKLLQNIGIRTIALEAGMVLIPEKEKVLQYANQSKMVIYGI